MVLGEAMTTALIISTDEPQLTKCLESVRNQIVPFQNIIHINNVVPEAKAFEEGMKKVKSEWIMVVNGDMILGNKASSIALGKIIEYKDQKVGQIHFALYDPFVRGTINACCAMKVEALRSVERIDKLRDDVWVMYRMRRIGWITKQHYRGRNKIIIGSHFESPDNFQIFRRFFIAGIKKNHQALKRMKAIFLQISIPEYDLAIRSMEFGMTQTYYPGSHNIEYDRKMYEEFNGYNS
jgi:hypothetical protein